MQSYSLNQSRLLEPCQTHASPPTVFALSPTSHLLLSASDSPPLIYLTNLALGTRPISIRPQCSSSTVVAVNFHPERPNIFILAFADGSAAVYDAVQLFHDNGKGERRSGPAGTGIGGEIASIKRLHAGGTGVSENEYSQEPSAGTIGIGYKGLGITAAAFVPGFNAASVTVGADGKCCVIDFSKRGARLLHTWHLRAPATSLAILLSTGRSQNGGSQADGATRSRSHSMTDGGHLVAIGRQDGKAVLFDLAGNLRGEQPIDPSGTRIIDVEWMSGDGTNEHDSSKSKRRKSGQSTPLAAIPLTKRKSLGSLLAGRRPVSEEVVAVTDELEPPLPNISFNSSTPQHLMPTRDRVIFPSGPALNHLDLFSPVKSALSTEVISGGSSMKSTKKIRGASERARQFRDPKLNENFSDHTQVPKPRTSSSRSSSAEVRSHPAVPPRPTPRKGGQLAAKRSETARLAAANKADGKVISNARNTTDKISQRSKGLALFAPYMKKNVLAEPRKSQPEASANATMSGALTSTEESTEDPWMDIVAGPSQTTREAPLKPSPATTKSYRTAPSFISEASNDTIVTWSTGTSRQPAASMHSEAPIPNIVPKAKKGQKKGHISLTQSTESEDTIVQWNSFKRPPKAFYIHQDQTLSSQTNPPPSSHTSPIVPGSFPTAVLPLAEGSHNLRVPSNLDQQPHPFQSKPPSQPQTQPHCPCLQNHQALLGALQEDVAIFKKEMETRLVRQEKWVEQRLVELEEGKVRLEGENRKLRVELGRVGRRKREL